VRTIRRSSPVRFAVRDAVAEVTLAAGNGNRLDSAMMAGLCAAAAAAVDDARVRVLVLTGRGPSFCEGATEPVPDLGEGLDGIAAIAALPMPTIAALTGRVTGLGLALALACDLRCAAANVRLEAVDPVRGALPGGGGLARLPRLIGPARAAEMALLGRVVRASTAQTWGLVTTVTPNAAVRTVARGLARTIATRGPLALRYAKEAVGRALDLPLDDGIRLEQDLYVLLQTTADRRAGVAAFQAKRRPRFHGR
jgi:enoyl-CoA hydratase/carnithine racemase